MVMMRHMVNPDFLWIILYFSFVLMVCFHLFRKGGAKSVTFAIVRTMFQRLASQIWALTHLHEKCKSNIKNDRYDEEFLNVKNN